MPTRTPTLRGDDEVDAIPTSLVGNGVGVLTLLGWLFWMLSTGRLVTRREHENRMADKDKAIADQSEQTVMWKAAADTKDAQAKELLELARFTAQHMEALEAKANERSSGDPQ